MTTTTEYGFTRGSYWIRLPNGLKQSTRLKLNRDAARVRFRYMLRNECGGGLDADWIIDRIDNPPELEPFGADDPLKF